MQNAADGQKNKRIAYLRKRGILDLVDVTVFDLEVEGGVFVKVKVFTPKALPESGNPAMIWAHGGWGILLDYSADHENMVEYAHNL